MLVGLARFELATPLTPRIGGPRYAALTGRAGPMKAARKRLGVLPRAVRWAQVGPNDALSLGLCRDRRATTRAILLRPTARGKERPVSTGIASNELEHHVFPVVRYTQIGGSAAGPTAVAGSAFTFGEGTLVTCWHCRRHLCEAV